MFERLASFIETTANSFAEQGVAATCKIGAQACIQGISQLLTSPFIAMTTDEPTLSQVFNQELYTPDFVSKVCSDVYNNCDSSYLVDAAIEHVTPYIPYVVATAATLGTLGVLYRCTRPAAEPEANGALRP